MIVKNNNYNSSLLWNVSLNILIFILMIITILIILEIKYITIKEINDAIFFKIYSILVSFYILSRFLISYFYKPHISKFDLNYKPRISYVIPCKNEESAIQQTILRIAQQDYEKSKMEIIIINDGSTDNSLQKMLEIEGEVNKLGVRTKIINWVENRGKRDGMAEGARQSSSELIFYVDSDSFLESNATKEIIKYFKSEKIAAVVGHAYVANENKNIITKMQSVRYFIAFKAYKASEAIFGSVTCCSGCCSVYRKSFLMEILSDWENQKFLGQKCTFGDDRSLTNYLLKKGYDAVFAPEAIAYTIVPDTFQTFLKQQLRWKKSWCRESLIAATYMYKKNIIVSVSFYLSIILPLLAPLIVFRALIFYPIKYQQFPYYYLFGLLLMAFLYGLYYLLHTRDRKWIFGVLFAAYYSLILIWQLPYAILTIRNTNWGTR